MRLAALVAGVGILMTSSSCSSLRPAAPAPADSTNVSPPAAAPPDSAPAMGGQQESPPDQGDKSAPPGGANSPPCVCASSDAKPKPTVKPKPKPVPKVAQPPPAPVAAASPPATETAAQVRSLPVSVTSILGRRVQGAKGEDLGRVVDVLADSSGRVRVAVIDFGGFLGVGDRRIAVEWPLLRFSMEANEPIVLTVGFDQLKAVPEFKGTPRPQTLMIPAAPAPASTDGGTPVDDKK